MYMCDLLCKLIKIHTRSCVGGQIPVPTKLVVLRTPQWTHNQPTGSDMYCKGVNIIIFILKISPFSVAVNLCE